MSNEFCSNCGEIIWIFQIACVFQGRVVCEKCDRILRTDPAEKEKDFEDIVKRLPEKDVYHAINENLSTEQKILSAIQNKAPISIVYLGGSQPGRKRKILPIGLKGDLLEAVCLITGQTKNFSIEKIDFSDINDAKPYNPSDGYHPDEIQTVSEIKQDLLDKISAVGWHIKKTNCSLEVYLYFKNGKLKKTPEVELFRSAYSGWCVRSKTVMPAVCFEHSSEALGYFLEQTKSVRVYRDHLY